MLSKKQEYISAIQRELEKRETAYPKMLYKLAEKVDRLQTHPEEYYELKNKQQQQIRALKSAKDSVKISNPDPKLEPFYRIELAELVREMDMRLRYYPMMIMRHQITKEDAEAEKQIWRELIEYFNEYYTPRVTVVFLKTRCRIHNS